MNESTPFPAGFLWGAATSAYQIEGSPLADGAGPSNWHRFSHTPGRTRDGDTGDIACDHYRRWRDDVRLMRELGLNAYRFSISWSRILPEGTGRVNSRGLAFYDRLVDELLGNGISPMVTLFHWDLPAALEDRGGWLVRDIAEWFADYARVVFAALGDRVPLWATLNEPWVVMDAGYAHDVHPPGERNWEGVPVVSHNLLRAHALAVRAHRAEGGGDIGLVVNLEPKYAASERPEDIAATERADAYMNRHYLDPLFLGEYPAELRELFGADWPEFPDEDFQLIREPIDFLGINYYTRSVTRAEPSSTPLRAGRVPQERARHTELDWEVYPDGLSDVLEWVRSRYGDRPLYVTENGAAFADPPVADGPVVRDPLRVDYLMEHLRAVARARESGVDVRGYFAWSLLDNFEWAEGYSKRFGLYHVNFATQQRTPKTSARFYADVIRSNGAALTD
ncbi:MAG: GH1 family beta-glucosidase [Longimicrobiales bacterium]